MKKKSATLWLVDFIKAKTADSYYKPSLNKEIKSFKKLTKFYYQSKNFFYKLILMVKIEHIVVEFKAL